MTAKVENFWGNREELEPIEQTAQLPDSVTWPITDRVQERVEWEKLALISNRDFLKTYTSISDRCSKITNPSLQENDIVTW